MAKTKYQEEATNYARQYLEQLLKMEDILGIQVNEKNKRK